MNYFTPSNGAKHITPIRTPIDFNDCQALIVEGREDSRISLITVQDLANVVARAVEYPGEWPVIGGIRGTELPVGQLVALGEKIRGKSYFFSSFARSHILNGLIAYMGILQASLLLSKS